MREAKAERAELRDTVQDLLRASPEAELPRHAAQVMQAERDLGGFGGKNWGNDSLKHVSFDIFDACNDYKPGKPCLTNPQHPTLGFTAKI